ncbi:MAG: SPFH domain-containing protein [Clostridia bacterium]|nr:SPFH domain-containing protein [Clostridia bacterium]MCR4885503.1 SPFH domain-containing protein [Clostridiales bacterium]
MGIFSVISGQFIDVIEWKDSSPNTMVYRYDRGGKEIMMGAQLTVRESQVAIMVNEGRIADVFQPGRYELSTQNMPVMTLLQSWKYGFNSPFKAEVYFINTRQFLDQKWGTSSPVMMRDSEFGMIRLRAHGAYSFRVADPKVFLKEVFGTAAYMTTEGVTGQLKRILVSGFSDAVAQSKIPALDLAANYDELGEFALKTLAPRIESLGLKLESFVIENISLPDQVEQAMDQHTSMNVVGDLQQYAQYQAATAIHDAANNQNGAAGMGAGMGAGAMLGQMISQAFQQAPAAAPQAQQAAPAEYTGETKYCCECGQKIPRSAKFCPECGTKQPQ